MDNCEKILEKVCEDLSEDINSKLCNELRDHLEDCDYCRSQIESMRDTVSLFKCLDIKQVPLDIHQRLVKMLNVETPE